MVPHPADCPNYESEKTDDSSVDVVTAVFTGPLWIL